LNVRQADKSENVSEVENIHEINESFVFDQLKMLLTEIKTEKVEKRNSVNNLTREINEEKNEELLQRAR